MKRPFRVAIEVITSYETVIDANTPEEAESIAETYLGDGELDQGLVANQEFLGAHATPVDVGHMGELHEEAY